MIGVIIMKPNGRLSESFRAAGFSDGEIGSLMAGVAALRAEELSFSEYFEENFGDAFTASETLYTLISETAAHYSNYVEGLSQTEKEGKISTYTALSTLHTRASQEYLEILTLVKNGFSDGAFARWRSMYELSVISSFIRKFGEPVAEKFIEASDTQDRYDWAMESGAFSPNKRHVTFGDIVKLCDMDVDAWAENYTVANQTVHASPQGTFGRLGAESGASSRRSGYGVSAPAIQCANTLALVSSMLFSLFPEQRTMEKMSLAAGWLDELIDAYCEAHEKLFE